MLNELKDTSDSHQRHLHQQEHSNDITLVKSNSNVQSKSSTIADGNNQKDVVAQQQQQQQHNTVANNKINQHEMRNVHNNNDDSDDGDESDDDDDGDYDGDDSDDDAVITQTKADGTRTGGMAVGGNHKELFIPEDISIYFIANNASDTARAAASAAASGAAMAPLTTLLAMGNGNGDNNSAKRYSSDTQNHHYVPMHMSAVHRRRRHRRSESATTQTNCLPECGTEYEERQQKLQKQQEQQQQLQQQQQLHLLHHHHRQNHHHSELNSPNANANVNSSGDVTKTAEIQRPLLPADTPTSIASSSGEQILFFESNNNLGFGGGADAGGADVNNRTANTTDELGSKHTVPLVENDHIIIIADETVDEETVGKGDDLYVNDEVPKTLPLRPIIRGPYNDDSDGDDPAAEVTTVYTEQHAEVKLNCEVDLDISAVVWMRNGQVSGDEKIKALFSNELRREAEDAL